jgi:type II secretory pathway predicted ATPase ExeA
VSSLLSGKWIGSLLTTILFKCLFVNSFFKQRSYEIRLLARTGHANNLDEIAGSQHDYIHCLFGVGSGGQAELGTILTPQAIDMLATKVRAPLQVQLHLTLALEAGYQAGEKPITAELVETVLSHQIGDLD